MDWFDYNFFALCLGLLMYLSEGLNYAQLGPFFPTNAIEEHGASTTWVGIITAVANVAAFCGVWISAPFINENNQKYVFCTGAFVACFSQSVFGIIGGWTDQAGGIYISVCLASRSVLSSLKCPLGKILKLSKTFEKVDNIHAKLSMEHPKIFNKNPNFSKRNLEKLSKQQSFGSLSINLNQLIFET